MLTVILTMHLLKKIKHLYFAVRLKYGIFCSSMVLYNDKRIVCNLYNNASLIYFVLFINFRAPAACQCHVNS